MSQIVSEEIGVPLDRIPVEYADTADDAVRLGQRRQQDHPDRGRRRLAPRRSMSKRQLIELAADQLKLPVADLTMKDGAVVAVADPTKKVAIADIAALRRRSLVVGVGYRGPNPADKAINPLGRPFLRG